MSGQSRCPSPQYVHREVEGTVEWMRLDCKERTCAYCGPRWKRGVQAKIFRGVQGAQREGRPVRVLTLTAPGKTSSGEEWWRDKRKRDRWNASYTERFGAFMDEIRRTLRQVKIDYFKVLEWQKRRLLHSQGLVAGIQYVDLTWLKRVAVKHGFGERLEFREPVGGIKNLCGYVTKYVLKHTSGEDGTDTGTRLHVATWSHGWAPDWAKRRKPKESSGWTWLSELDWWSRYGAPAYQAEHPGEFVSVDRCPA